MSELNQTIWELKQCSEQNLKKLTHASLLESNLKKDLEFKTKEFRDMSEKFEITSRCNAEKIKSENSAQEKLKGLSSEMEK